MTDRPATDIRSPQDRETATTLDVRVGYAFRYAFARSDDSRRAGDPGQDYLAIRDDGARFAFAVCDGVSQSFMGDLAARILGDALIEWLWAAPMPAAESSIAQALAAQLAGIVPAASRDVAAYRLPDDLAEIVQVVLEQKRALGSESTFVCGLVDAVANRAVFAWMGDCRLYLWRSNDDRVVDLGNTFLTRERWSTKRGGVGETHVKALEASSLRRLVAFSDGFVPAAKVIRRPPSRETLDRVIVELGEQPISDDISYLEWWAGKVPALDDDVWLDAPPEPTELVSPPIVATPKPPAPVTPLTPPSPTGRPGWLVPVILAVLVLAALAVAWLVL